MKKLSVRFTAALAALSVALCFVLPAFMQQAAAAELKPVLTVKLASLETFAEAGTKIAELAGYKEQWNEILAQIESLEGVNTKNPFWLVLRSDGNEIKAPILYLPIDDFDKLNLPIADALKSDLKDDGKGGLRLNSPFGLFVAVKKKGAYVITLQEYIKDLPDDPNTFIAGLEKYLLGVKVEFANTSEQSIQNALAPIQMIAAIQNPDSAEPIEQLVKTLLEFHKQAASVSFGLIFNAGSADLEIETALVPRKDSDIAKQLKEIQQFKSAFNGFTFSDKETVFSANNVQYIDDAALKALEEGFKTFSTGALAQLEENEDIDEDTLEIAENYLILIKDTATAVLTKGINNAAGALSSDGILIGAVNVNDTGKINEFFKQSFEVIKKTIFKNDESAAGEADELLKKYGKKDAKTIADFKVSSLIVPLNELKDKEQLPKVLKNKTFTAYWAVKENTAVAFAAGFDEQKTEKAFTEALEAAKKPDAAKAPQAVFALRPLGVLLKNYGIDGTGDKAKLITDALIASGSNAKVTVSVDTKADSINSRIAVSGSTVAALAKLIKIFQQEDAVQDGAAGRTLERKTITDF
ncbi:hypothetical protein FACS18942_09340 [Planctomycetales bacterium]|nr:hypothetical protein FACS18942_09340 [Planctomycetales bacterium]